MENFKSNLIEAAAPNAEALAKQLMAQFDVLPNVADMVAAAQQDNNQED